MAKEIYFFATSDDLLNIVNDIEQLIEVQYIEAKAYDSKKIIQYSSLKEYESLGTNQSGEHQSESFLVLLKSDNLIVREVQQVGGGNKYFVDQNNNKDTVIFWPGGTYNEEYLICGHMGTLGDSNISKKIFNIFQKCIKKYCKNKVGKYYISEAVKKSCQDMRLITININQPKEYDVKLE